MYNHLTVPVQLQIPDPELLTVPAERIEEIFDTSRPYYSDAAGMLFHGPDHPVRTTNWFLRDWVICARNGYVTDIEAGVGATGHHDSNYHIPLKDSGYQSKEARSADIASRELAAIRFTPAQIALTRGGILATKAGNTCVNLLEKQIVRSDLANTRLPYRTFLRYFMKQAKEQRFLNGVFTPFDEVKDITIQVLSLYFGQDLSYPFEKKCPVTVQGLAHLDRLKHDDETTVSALAGEDFRAD